MAQYVQNNQIAPEVAMSAVTGLAKRGAKATRILKPQSVDWRDGILFRENAERAKDIKYQDILENLRGGDLAGLDMSTLDCKSIAVGAVLGLAALIFVKKMGWDRRLKLDRIGL